MMNDTPALRDAFFSLPIGDLSDIDELRLEMHRAARVMAEERRWEILGHLELQLPITEGSNVRPTLFRTYIFKPL